MTRKIPRSRDPSESQIVRSVLAFLLWDPRIADAWRNNTGAIKIDQARFVKFGRKGNADIEGYAKDGRYVAIECKSRLGRATVSQAAFIAKVQANHGIAGFARSVDDAKAIVDAAFPGTRGLERPAKRGGIQE